MLYKKSSINKLSHIGQTLKNSFFSFYFECVCKKLVLQIFKIFCLFIYYLYKLTNSWLLLLFNDIIVNLLESIIRLVKYC